jgi:hypothetical protein
MSDSRRGSSGVDHIETLQAKTLKEIQEIARQLGVKPVTGLKKQALIDRIRESVQSDTMRRDQQAEGQPEGTHRGKKPGRSAAGTRDHGNTPEITTGDTQGDGNPVDRENFEGEYRKKPELDKYRKKTKMDLPDTRQASLFPSGDVFPSDEELIDPDDPVFKGAPVQQSGRRRGRPRKSAEPEKADTGKSVMPERRPDDGASVYGKERRFGPKAETGPEADAGHGGRPAAEAPKRRGRKPHDNTAAGDAGADTGTGRKQDHRRGAHRREQEAAQQQVYETDRGTASGYAADDERRQQADQPSRKSYVKRGEQQAQDDYTDGDSPQQRQQQSQKKNMQDALPESDAETLLERLREIEPKLGGFLLNEGTLEILPDGYGFMRSANYHYSASPDDIYVSPSQIKRFCLKQGDTVVGVIRPPKVGERYFALLRVDGVNGQIPARYGFPGRF